MSDLIMYFPWLYIDGNQLLHYSIICVMLIALFAFHTELNLFDFVEIEMNPPLSKNIMVTTKQSHQTGSRFKNLDAPS